MPHTLPALPYAYDALEPVIDARTMELHHTRHHAAYLATLNRLLGRSEFLRETPLEDILLDIRRVPEDIRQDVRNYGGAHLNHCLFWRVMSPSGGGEPTGLLGQVLEAEFGGVTRFRERFSEVAMRRFGSGWAWACVDANGSLELTSTPNQDPPIMLGLRPILGLDLWEHAYYLQYQHRRIDYVHAWWDVVDWGHVTELYTHAMELVARARHPQ